jgi:hypothetical protein
MKIRFKIGGQSSDAEGETPKEKAIRQLAEVRRQKSFLEKSNDDTNEDEAIIKTAKAGWQSDVAEFFPEKKVFSVSKINNENGAVYFEGEDSKWSASVKKEGLYFFASLIIKDKINFDVYGVTSYHDLKVGLTLIKKAVKECA